MEKHIAIDWPSNSGSQDYNYEGFFSLSLLAVCDAKYRFSLVNGGQYGSKNDSGVLIASEIGKEFETNSLAVPEPEKLDGGG